MLTYLGVLGGKLVITENTDPSGRNRPQQIQMISTRKDSGWSHDLLNEIVPR